MNLKRRSCSAYFRRSGISENETNPVPEIEITTEKEFYEIAPEFKKYSCVYINIANPETEYTKLVNNHYVIKNPVNLLSTKRS